MAKKFNKEEIPITIDNTDVFSNQEYEGISIKWHSTIGFGQYTIYRERDTSKWYANSEYMDSNDNKKFLKALLEKFADDITIDN